MGCSTRWTKSDEGTAKDTQWKTYDLKEIGYLTQYKDLKDQEPQRLYLAESTSRSSLAMHDGLIDHKVADWADDWEPGHLQDSGPLEGVGECQEYDEHYHCLEKATVCHDLLWSESTLAREIAAWEIC